MLQHRIFIKKTVDVCKKCPSKNQRSQTVHGRSGQGLDFCHWSLKILIFWYRPFAKRFWRLSILSVQKKSRLLRVCVCTSRCSEKIRVDPRSRRVTKSCFVTSHLGEMPFGILILAGVLKQHCQHCAKSRCSEKSQCAFWGYRGTCSLGRGGGGGGGGLGGGGGGG